MKPRGPNVLRFAVVGLLLLAVFLAIRASTQENTGPSYVRAQYLDRGMLGGKGYRLLLERLGYQTRRVTARLEGVPEAARVWLILDPYTRFSTAEGKDLLAWIERGGVLIWAGSPSHLSLHPTSFKPVGTTPAGAGGINHLKAALRIETQSSPGTVEGSSPRLSVMGLDTATPYRTGVTTASGAPDTLDLTGPYTEIAGSPVQPQLVRLDRGKGHIFLLAGPHLFSNHGLAQGDNAVLATNLVRYHVPSGLVVFDERNHVDTVGQEINYTLGYYLWRPPLRYAWLQLLLAGLLYWALVSRRHGAAIPLPTGGPVTRASQFAGAMGALFRRANRPKAAAGIIGESFRRQLAQRIGMSPADADQALARRTHEISGLPENLIDKLLLQSRAPADNESEALRDTQAMEQVLRKLGVRRNAGNEHKLK